MLVPKDASASSASFIEVLGSSSDGSGSTPGSEFLAASPESVFSGVFEGVLLGSFQLSASESEFPSLFSVSGLVWSFLSRVSYRIFC